MSVQNPVVMVGEQPEEQRVHRIVLWYLDPRPGAPEFFTNWGHEAILSEGDSVTHLQDGTFVIEYAARTPAGRRQIPKRTITIPRTYVWVEESTFTRDKREIRVPLKPGQRDS